MASNFAFFIDSPQPEREPSRTLSCKLPAILTGKHPPCAGKLFAYLPVAGHIGRLSTCSKPPPPTHRPCP